LSKQNPSGSVGREHGEFGRPVLALPGQRFGPEPDVPLEFDDREVYQLWARSRLAEGRGCARAVRRGGRVTESEERRMRSPDLRTAESRVDVRRAGPDDAAVVLAMVREIAADEGDAEHVAGTEHGWAQMLGRDDVVVLVAERDGVPVGYVSAVRTLHLWTGGDILALDDLYVRAGSRDAGVGRLLMTELARWAAPQNLLIRWEMQEDNTAAQRFYRRLGATLRTKVIAGWKPAAQRAALEH
jgi:GNAT superfamily N-acetyltransferase